MQLNTFNEWINYHPIETQIPEKIYMNLQTIIVSIKESSKTQKTEKQIILQNQNNPIWIYTQVQEKRF